MNIKHYKGFDIELCNNTNGRYDKTSGVCSYPNFLKILLNGEHRGKDLFRDVIFLSVKECEEEIDFYHSKRCN